TTPPTQEVELDLLAMGVTGSQLCWKVDISSPNERCVPIIDDVDIGYQAVRSGAYARSSPSTLGNVAIWGVNETPGQAWGTGWSSTKGSMPGPGIRAYDGTKDYGIRGRLYLQSLYFPEDPSKTDAKEQWEAGRVMALSLTSGELKDRKLYTTDASGNRVDVKQAALALFPDSLCNDYSEIDGRFRYDLNHDGRCGTPTIDKNDFPEKNIPGPENDRDFLVDWLYGYENRLATGSNNQRRPWAMGGINLSTVAVAVPPYQDHFYQNAKPTERDLYRDNFMKPMEKRDTVAYVGTMTGALHAFDTGDFRNALRDGCLGYDQQRGYFEPKACGSATSPADREYGTGKELFSYMPSMMISQYRNQYVRFRGSTTLPKPQIDASPTIANVDLGTKADWNDSGIEFKWTPAATKSRNTGAKTVLVSASGKSSPVVFSLDITHPELENEYPLPMWEFSLADSTVATEFAKDSSVKPPDNTGSRHAPSVARIAWGPDDKNKRWVAVVGTDYEPANKRAGAVFLLDMKTGRPLDFDSTAAGKLAGVITFEEGVGIAAETALLDLDQDGTYDVMYVPTTNGSIWRVNLKKVTKGNKLGNKVDKCMVAKASVALKGQVADKDLDYQQLYSNMAVKLISTDKGPSVRFFFGTGDNPDQYTDGPKEVDPKNPKFQYFLLGFEDTDPKSEKACKSFDPMWVQKLEPGEKLWGGVTVSAENVYAATAVGAAADICNLSDKRNGSAYTANQLTGAIKKSALDGHAISPPVVHDEHLFVLTATGKMKIMGGKKWNNKSGLSSIPRSQIMLWESMPDGRLPQ
ncbi:pilus assembly protein, partial [Corallococcus exercitus]|nr:pilus assembly protein [Corallococcus exercitus]